MSTKVINTDIAILGAGPVGLMCAYLGQRCGLQTVIVDKSQGPLKLGRADALNARTLQLLEVVDLFDALYPLGKTCNTSSVWKNGAFVSRQSQWWDELEGCFHKHFLMLGQAYVEQLLDAELQALGAGVKRSTEIKDISLHENGCRTTLSNGTVIQSRYLIGADGSRSFVRKHFNIPFHIVKPQIVWAVLDGVLETDFPKVPEIIVFQAATSDVAWIPREGNIDRFYVRMDTKQFTVDEAVAKINNAIHPHQLRFKELEWFSQFSVKESVAERFYVHRRVFLAGDACHIHSVNGGQGLNTGLADAFNLLWKLHRVIRFGDSAALLQSYEDERKPVAESVIESSGELVRSTKYSATGTHAEDYVHIVQKRAGNITGMGIRYGQQGLSGTRLFDFEVQCKEGTTKRIYTLLEYSTFTLLLFGRCEAKPTLPEGVKLICIAPTPNRAHYWSTTAPYAHQAVLVRPDAYIQRCVPLTEVESLFEAVVVA